MPAISNPVASTPNYRGLAPSPTGYLHLGHARTFWTAQSAPGLPVEFWILRNEDLTRPAQKLSSPAPCSKTSIGLAFNGRMALIAAGLTGLTPKANARASTPPRSKSFSRANSFIRALVRAKIFNLQHRRHIRQTTNLIYPGICRDNQTSQIKNQKYSWRFRVPDGETINFIDGHFGPQQFVAGKDFGDFVVWRPDGVPAYQLAVVVDDAAMKITGSCVRAGFARIHSAANPALSRAGI